MSTVDQMLLKRRQRIAVSLCSKQTERAVDICIEDVASKNASHPLLRIFAAGPLFNGGIDPNDLSSVQLGESELVILYVVDGVCEGNDDRIFCFDGANPKLFELHARLGRTMRYLLLFSTQTADEDGDRLCMQSVDVVPSLAFFKTKAAVKIASRQSVSLERAKAIIDSAERGAIGADVETALSDCCAWLLESQQLVASQFRRHLVDAADGNAMGIVEALLKRYSSLRHVADFVAGPESPFSQLANGLVHSSSPAHQRWQQRRAHLDLLLESYRAEAVWASALAPLLMTLKFHDAHRQQTVEPLVQLTQQLMLTLALVCATCPVTHAVDDTGAGATLPSLHSLITGNVIPSIAFSFVRNCENLLQLTTCFSVAAVADAAEQQGYIMPLCTRDAFMAKFSNAAEALRGLVAAYDRTSTMLEKCFPNMPGLRRKLAGLSPNATEAEASAARRIAVATASYAADRCNDIEGLVKRIDKVGYGMMTPQVACLFATVHKAANSFPLLRAAEHKNWQLFMHSFDKSATLKYTEVEPVEYATPQPLVVGDGFASLEDSVLGDGSTIDATVVNSSTVLHNNDLSMISVHMQSTTRANTAVDASLLGLSSGAAATEIAVLREERAILGSRVTILTEEVVECRRLLTAVQRQLDESNQRLASAEELNVVLMAEMRDLYMRLAAVELPAGDSDRDRLVKALAEDSVGPSVA